MIPASVESEQRVFYECEALERAVIGEDTAISESMFDGCRDGRH